MRRRCKNVEPLLGALLDGELDERRAVAVRGHLRTCASCERRREELSRIVEAARGLEPLDPPDRLWAAIDARLADEEARDADRPTWWWWWQASRRPVLAGGAVLGVAALALVFHFLRAPAPPATRAASPAEAPAAPPARTTTATAAASARDRKLMPTMARPP